MAGFRAMIIAISAVAISAGNPAMAHKGDDEHDGVMLSISMSNDSGMLVMKSDGLHTSAKWDGVHRFSEDARTLEMLDGDFEIELTKDDVTERIVFTGNGTSIAQSFYRNDRKREADRTYIGAILRTFILESGKDAEERTAVLYEGGGIQSVFAEIDDITGSHGTRKYLTALAKLAPLSENNLSRYIDKITGLDNDHDKRKAIIAALENQSSLSAQTRARLFRAGRDVESSHEIRKLIAAISRDDITRDTINIATEMIARIEEGHEFRKSAIILLETNALTTKDVVSVLTLAQSRAEEDHERRKIVVAAAKGAAQSPDVAGAAIAIARTMSEDHEQRKAIAALASRLSTSSPHWAALLDIANMIDDDHEKRKALQIIAHHAPSDTTLTAIYLDIAKTISSDHERKKALASIE